MLKLLIVAGTYVTLSVSVVGQEVGSKITELKLVNGKTFTNVTVVRLDGEKAVFKNAAGPFPVPYTSIAQPMRKALEGARDGKHQQQEAAAAHASSAAITPKVQPIIVSGSAFSGGMDLPFRFAGMRIVVVQRGDEKERDASDTQLGKFDRVVSETATDVDGKFSLQVPPGEYTLLARQLRSYRNGNRVPYNWRVPLTAKDSEITVTLNDDNARIEPTFTRR